MLLIKFIVKLHYIHILYILYTYTYVHTYIHTFIHTYIHTYIRRFRGLASAWVRKNACA